MPVMGTGWMGYCPTHESNAASDVAAAQLHALKDSALKTENDAWPHDTSRVETCQADKFLGA